MMKKIISETFKNRMHKSQILHLLHERGKLSQIAIGRQLKLPKTTVSKIVNSAIRAGLIKNVGTDPRRRRVPGMRPVLLGLEEQKSMVLGLAVRNDCFHSGMVNFRGEVFNYQSRVLDDFKPENLPGMINEAVKNAAGSGRKILGVGLAIGGFFTGRNRSMVPDSKNLKALIDVPQIADDYPNAAATAELLFGQARGKDSFVFLQLRDEHCRVSCYSNGNIVRGTHGLAGEVSTSEVIHEDIYKSPFRLYRHRKLRLYEESSPAEIEEHSFYLAHMLLEIILYYDPRQIIISGIPQKVWTDKIHLVVDSFVKNHLKCSLYNLQYEIVRESQWQNREVIYGASLIFEDILTRPRIQFNESAIG